MAPTATTAQTTNTLDRDYLADLPEEKLERYCLPDGSRVFDHPMWSTQVELERGMRDEGADNVTTRVADALEKDNLTRLPQARRLVREWLAPVSEDLSGWLRRCAASRGPNPVAMLYLTPSCTTKRLSSRNDNISIAFIDTGVFRAGPVGKILFQRSDDDKDLRGLGTVRWGGEVGGFVDLFPTQWLRLRAEVRQGFRAHSGVAADVSADAFHDLSPSLRLSAGPRVSMATGGYYKAYFGVNATQSAASGLAVYSPGSGIRAAGFGGALTWKVTDKVTTSLFAEYSRLLGPAADSSLVRQRGSVNQFTLGASATYRFDFAM